MKYVKCWINDISHEYNYILRTNVSFCILDKISYLCTLILVRKNKVLLDYLLFICFRAHIWHIEIRSAGSVGSNLLCTSWCGFKTVFLCLKSVFLESVGHRHDWSLDNVCDSQLTITVSAQCFCSLASGI